MEPCAWTEQKCDDQDTLLCGSQGACLGSKGAPARTNLLPARASGHKQARHPRGKVSESLSSDSSLFTQPASEPAPQPPYHFPTCPFPLHRFDHNSGALTPATLSFPWSLSLAHTLEKRPQAKLPWMDCWIHCRGDS